jgi:cell fate (sporulation/competence/biofilm development) regulator YlbF (YheA/YmcA/DUF963 family)
MESVLKLAEELGRAIAASDRYKALRTAEKEVEADETALSLQNEYTQIATKIRDLESAGKPIEPGDKRALQAKKEELAQNVKIQEVTRAWADYNEMINKVNRLVFEKLGKE